MIRLPARNIILLSRSSSGVRVGSLGDMVEAELTAGIAATKRRDYLSQSPQRSQRNRVFVENREIPVLHELHALMRLRR